MKRWIVGVAAAVAGLGGAGCSGVSSYAVPTTAEARPVTRGPIAIFATRPPGVGRELGVVEVRGDRGENNVEVLFPELVRRAQGLGANAIIVDWMGARFQLVTTYVTQTSLFPCGPRSFCGTQVAVPTTTEEVHVVLRGRAWLLPEEAP
jgi:hypothetical protein